jgi:hypothetical protein
LPREKGRCKPIFWTGRIKVSQLVAEVALRDA